MGSKMKNQTKEPRTVGNMIPLMNSSIFLLLATKTGSRLAQIEKSEMVLNLKLRLAKFGDWIKAR
jgi:hypothetical protein